MESKENTMRKENIYVSTIATDAVRVAKEYGLGLEIAEYCTAWNMDEKFAGVDGVVKKKLEDISESLLHAPYNELFPCAIDKKARQLAAYRYRQAIDLAKRYGAKKVIIHGGYNPRIIMTPVTTMSYVFYAGYAVFCLMPLGLELWTEYRFKKARRAL